MSIGYQINDQFGTYFLTLTIVDWVDLFTRKIYKDLMIETLNFSIIHKKLLVYAYVIMSNHIHLILQSGGDIPLSDIVRDCKKFTSKKFLEVINSSQESRKDWLLHRFQFNAAKHQRNSHYQIWTHENHAIEIKSLSFFEQKQNYIHQNPVRAGYVDFAEDYVYSCAYELAGRGKKLDISQWR